MRFVFNVHLLTTDFDLSEETVQLTSFLFSLLS